MIHPISAYFLCFFLLLIQTDTGEAYLYKAGLKSDSGERARWRLHSSSLKRLPSTSGIKHKMSSRVTGELFIYSEAKRLAAFRSGGSSSRHPPSADAGAASAPRRGKFAVFVPGITDGLLGRDYVPALGAALDRVGYSLIQPVMSSSYKGYGTSSLHQDVEELDELLQCLSVSSLEEGNDGGMDVVMIGHSTGCQDSVFYMKHGKPDLRANVRGVVLQAPVSDREWLASLPTTEGLIVEARKRLGGKELMPADTDVCATTPSRFLSFATKEGDDDMFSSDLSPDEMRSRLGHMVPVPTAIFLSGADQYVPPGGERWPTEKLAEKYRKALSPPDEHGDTAAAGREPMIHIIEGANHGLEEEIHSRVFVERVVAFVSGLEEEAG